MEGPQQQPELHREHPGRAQSGHQRAGQALAWASSQVPPSTYHIISLCSRCISLPPSHLCSATKQQVVTVRVLSVPGHTVVAAQEGRSSSPSFSELCPGHTMPVMDRPHHQGSNPDLYWNQLVLAGDIRTDFWDTKQPPLRQCQAPSKARGTKLCHPKTPRMAACREVALEPPKQTQV